jgi:fatty-acyl-CoA synthase
MQMLERLNHKRAAITTELHAIRIAKRAGLIGGSSPLEVVRIMRTMRTLGAMTAALVNSARKHPDRTAIIDELGSVTYAELDRRTNVLANAWRQRGLTSGDGIAILSRNHRYLPYAVYAAGKVGARIVLLNTDFAGPQIREVAGREGVDLLVHDDEYAAFLDGVEPRLGRFRAWAEPDPDFGPGEDTLEFLSASGDESVPPPPASHAKIVVLTSGTTGTPKGAPRSEPKGVTPVAALLERAPFRSGDTVENCAPMFHSLGFAFMLLTIALGSTLVVRRRFDPERTLESIEANGSRSMVLVPVMLSRIIDLGDEAVAKRDLSSLEVVLLGGSQLGGELAEHALRVLGPVIHNLYGSTEVAYATIATPEDLLAEPACVGRPVLGTVVRLLDDNGREVPQGETGRIFVRNSIPFDGYTGGGHKEVIDGLMSSGDVGHFDTNGRLFVDGRDDEMIVSGGENVFPREIEELLEHLDDVADVACIDVPDEKYGQRLRAFVVRREGSALSEDTIKAHVKENLARYKVPRDVVFIDELPRNATGKVLKRELRQIEV